MMSPNTEGPLPTMFFQRVKDDTEEIDWAKFMQGPYELTPILQGIEAEAGMKGRVIVITVALVPADEYFDHDIEDDADTAGGDDTGLPDQEV